MFVDHRKKYYAMGIGKTKFSHCSRHVDELVGNKMYRKGMVCLGCIYCRKIDTKKHQYGKYLPPKRWVSCT